MHDREFRDGKQQVFYLNKQIEELTKLQCRKTNDTNIVIVSTVKRSLLRLSRVYFGYIWGQIFSVSATDVNAIGLSGYKGLGELVYITNQNGYNTMGEVVGVQSDLTRIMLLVKDNSITKSSIVSSRIGRHFRTLSIGHEWLGRVIDPFGSPIDGLGPLSQGTQLRHLHVAPPPAPMRRRLGEVINFGISVMDIFTPCREGQRVGIFAGAGVGKSTLVGMLARFCELDVIVVALVGERGKEVRDFLEDELGVDGRLRSVVIVATSDQTPVMRRAAAYSAMSVAEYFRDEGARVLLLFDSLTRFCQSLREIAFNAGEQQATRGYPASTFSELPRLLERAGPGFHSQTHNGSITAIFTVLSDLDAFDDPLADAIRGLLDGHIILDRRIAERGRLPAVDILRSLSRGRSEMLTSSEAEIVACARKVLTCSNDISELVRYGVYKKGNDAEADTAIRLAPQIENIFHQKPNKKISRETSLAALRNILDK